MNATAFSTNYSINFDGTLLSHGPATLLWLNDKLEDGAPRRISDRKFAEADALARSGDYFMLLATRLDLISQSLPHDSAEQIEVEHLIETLFYLQKHYTIVDSKKLHK